MLEPDCMLPARVSQSECAASDLAPVSGRDEIIARYRQLRAIAMLHHHKGLVHK